MRQAWRWFGPDDPVSLDTIRQAGATDVVSALHHIPIGEVWPLDAVLEHKQRIETALAGRSPLAWSVVESIPVHDDIKRGAPGWEHLADRFACSVRNVAEAGIRTICYNFMPVIDWTRTHLAHELPSGARALRFDINAFAAFDLFILQRRVAPEDWDEATQVRARALVNTLSEAEKNDLGKIITAGLPGRMTEGYCLDEFRAALHAFNGVGRAALRNNLLAFLERVLPVAEDVGVRLAIHPDDPPRPLLGLPRTMCTADDARALFDALPSAANGLTLCAGTFGVLPENDIPAMAEEFGERIAFAHLRGTRRDPGEERSFIEAEHLDSDIDMIAVIRNLLRAERHQVSDIVIRPDHGHQMLDDLGREGNPGYSAIGRLKGLAEIRGVVRTCLALQ